MTALILVVALGIVGGVILAFILFRLPSQEDAGGARTLDAPSTDIINMARVRVKGAGGLGMVAMAVTVAAFVPSIRLSMAIAVVLGVVMAVAMILWRRRSGPLSTRIEPGAHSMLPMDPGSTAPR
jgi:hypothetical protein